MSDTGHYSRPVNQPLNDERFNNRDDDGLGRPHIGICSDCGQPNSTHHGIVNNVPVDACPRVAEHVTPEDHNGR